MIDPSEVCRMAANRRLPYPDIVRGFAIILVVLGHCIQMGSGAAYYEASAFYDDRLYQFIYSFHMPLFMLISGYFAAFSMERADRTGTWRQFLARRARQLLIPIAFWTLFEIAVTFVRTLVQIPADDPVFRDKAVGLVKIELAAIPTHFVNELWFLWAILWSFLAVSLVRHAFRDSLMAYAVLELLMLLVPDALNAGVYKYVFSFFLVGYLCAANGSVQHLFEKIKGEALGRWRYVVFSGIIFAVAFLFFHKDTMIYLSGYRVLWGEWKLIAIPIVRNAYRFAIGMAGSVFFLLLFWQLFRVPDRGFRSAAAKVLEALGRETMGIYILSSYYIIFGIHELTKKVTPSYALNLFETAIALALSYGTARLLGRIPGLRRTIGKNSS